MNQNDSLLTPIATPRKVIRQFIATETPLHSINPSSPFAFTPFQPHLAAAVEIDELKQQLEQAKIEQEKMLAYCQQLEREVALLKEQLESKPILYLSANSQKGLKRPRSSSAESIPIAPKPFNTARQRLRERVSKEPIKSADDFLRSTLLTP